MTPGLPDSRAVIALLVALLPGCNPGPERVPEGWDDTAESCPSWYLAPAGEDWEYLYFCGPCGQAYSANRRADGAEVYWGEAGSLPCSCINEDHQWVQEDPDCQPNY